MAKKDFKYITDQVALHPVVAYFAAKSAEEAFDNAARDNVWYANWKKQCGLSRYNKKGFERAKLLTILAACRDQDFIDAVKSDMVELLHHESGLTDEARAEIHAALYAQTYLPKGGTQLVET